MCNTESSAEINKSLSNNQLFYKALVKDYSTDKITYWQLKNTKFFFVVFEGKLPWGKERIWRTSVFNKIPEHNFYQTSFEYVFDNITENIGSELLFDLDIFNVK